MSSQAVSLPGFADAFLTSYDEPGPGGDLLRTENVVGDLARGGLFVLTVKASPSQFDPELAAISTPGESRYGWSSTFT
ncbi:MAG: hypothetical protein KY440_00320 [Actinobacteria bacterium]|nr:hypothetical protein [Actinomycetota bacterium]